MVNRSGKLTAYLARHETEPATSPAAMSNSLNNEN